MLQDFLLNSRPRTPCRGAWRVKSSQTNPGSLLPDLVTFLTVVAKTGQEMALWRKGLIRLTLSEMLQSTMVERQLQWPECKVGGYIVFVVKAAGHIVSGVK